MLCFVSLILFYHHFVPKLWHSLLAPFGRFHIISSSCLHTCLAALCRTRTLANLSIPPCCFRSWPVSGCRRRRRGCRATSWQKSTDDDASASEALVIYHIKVWIQFYIWNQAEGYVVHCYNMYNVLPSSTAFVEWGRTWMLINLIILYRVSQKSGTADFQYPAI